MVAWYRLSDVIRETAALTDISQEMRRLNELRKVSFLPNSISISEPSMNAITIRPNYALRWDHLPKKISGMVKDYRSMSPSNVWGVKTWGNSRGLYRGGWGVLNRGGLYWGGLWCFTRGPKIFCSWHSCAWLLNSVRTLQSATPIKVDVNFKLKSCRSEYCCSVSISRICRRKRKYLHRAIL